MQGRNEDATEDPVQQMDLPNKVERANRRRVPARLRKALGPHPGSDEEQFVPVVSQKALNHRLQAAIPPGSICVGKQGQTELGGFASD
jgi:hypothetical protein